MLSEEGYEKLNIRAIASKCGIATDTLYNYYKSKHEIVEEILKTEWNAMLPRVDQAAKVDVKLVDKLGIIYKELCVLMNDVHNLWFDTSDLNVCGELSNIKCHKKTMLKDLEDKIFYLIMDEARNIFIESYEGLIFTICGLKSAIYINTRFPKGNPVK